MNKSLIIILFILYFINNGLIAQEADSLTIITTVKIDSLTLQTYEYPFDTSLFLTHYYNPCVENNISVSFLGNTGQALLNNNFFLRNKYQEFIFHSAYHEYFHKPFKTLHFNTKKPLTEIKYISSGSRANSEQVLNLLHTQNVNEYTNFGIRYDAISSRGIYIDQDSRSNYMTLFGSYDKEHYSIYGSIHTNKLNFKENGGLRNIDEFLEHKVNDLLVYTMNLTNANSTAKKTNFFFTQVLKNYDNNSDSSKSISFLPKGTAIYHTFDYSRFYRSYEDNIPENDTINFYERNYYKINSAQDSVFMQIIENSIKLNITETKRRLGLLAGIKHQFQAYNFIHPFWPVVNQDNTDIDAIISTISGKKYYNLSVNGTIGLNIPGFKTDLYGEYFFAGYRQHDISANILMKKEFKDLKTGIILGGSFNLSEPDLLLKHYASSHFIWKNDFKKIMNVNLHLRVSSKSGTIYAEGVSSVINNYIYFNNSAIPAVKEHNLYVSSLTLSAAFEWGIFNHIHDILLQKVSDTKVVHLPLLAYRNSTYLEKSFFNKALITQLGVDLYYNTSYFSDMYNPAIGIFHLQNIRETGNYPYLNGFLNWKVKRTRFFLKYTNLLAGIAGYNYFTTYGYPMYGRSLKFGLAWTFYD